MIRYKNRQAILLILCVWLTSVPAAESAPRTGPAEAQPAETFKFTKPDLDLLEQVNLLDKQFEKEGLVYQDGAVSAYVERVGHSLLPAGAAPEHVAWRFRVLRDPVPNAFALPNGSIYVNSGLLALLDDEAQLASVLAHEVTHVTKRHTYLQNRSTRKKVLAINIIEAIGFWNPAAGAAGLAVDLIASVSPFILTTTIFGYSRDLEREADREGVRLLQGAGYDPQEMVNTFKILRQDIEGEQLKFFYSDHPQLTERIAYVSTLANGNTAQGVGGTNAEYLTQIEKAARHDVQLAINSGRFRSAVYISRKLVALNPASSENTFYLAESYRALGPRAPELTDKELTTSAKKDAAKQKRKLTPAEEEQALMATPAGQAHWQANQQQAEELYQKSLTLDSANNLAHRGLGMLYEKAQRKQEAASEYQKYLELAPNAPDRERIARRLAGLQGH